MNLSDFDIDFISSLLQSELMHYKYSKRTLYVLNISESERLSRISYYDRCISYIETLIDKILN